MQLIPRAEIRTEWDAFCGSHAAAWFWHTNPWLDYCLAYKDGNVDRSFGMVNDGRLIAICPLVQQDGEFSAGGDPLAWPLWAPANIGDAMAGDWWLPMLRGKIDETAKQHGISRVRFRQSPLVAPDGNGQIWLLNYKDISWGSRVVDLTQSMDDIWKGVSKGHAATIHKGLRELDIYRSWEPRDMEKFRALHVEQAKCETRPYATWKMMTDWLTRGQARLFLAQRKGRLVGAAFFNQYKRASYYGSAAYAEENVAHAVIWTALREYCEDEHTQLEMGWMNSYGAEFKKGFGGQDKPLYVVEKTWA